MKQIVFHNWLCNVDISQMYANGRTAIILNDAEDGERVAVATINLPNEELKDDEVIIRDHSENEGMLMALVSNNIVTHPHREIRSGFVICPVSFLVEGNNPSETKNKS